MKKRIIAMALVLAMLVSFLPSFIFGVTADGIDPQLVVPTLTCDHANWENWGDAEGEWTTLPSAAGSYYLTHDVQLSATHKFEQDITLCLNGHTVKNADGVKLQLTQVKSGATLNLTDCTGNGQLTGGSNAGNGAAISVYRQSTLNLYGGNITGNASTGGSGGGVYIQQGNSATDFGGVFNMYGGKIYKNTAKVDGGAVWVGGVGSTSVSMNYAGQFNMYAGTLGGDTLADGNQSVSSGGGIYADGKVNIYGGTISCNQTSAGAAIYTKGILNISDVSIWGNVATGNGVITVARGGSMTMSGGTIGSAETGKSNRAVDGSAIYLQMGNNTGNGGVCTMSGGTVIGNTATRNGVVYVGGASGGAAASFTMTGGSIKNNTATENGGGVFNSGVLTLGGSASVTGNTAGAEGSKTTNNVYLNGTVITAQANLNSTDRIGVTHSKGMVAITGTVTKDLSSNFFSDAGAYVAKSGNVLVLTETEPEETEPEETTQPEEVTHTDHNLCGSTTCSHTGHNTLTWSPWGADEAEKSGLPTTAGNYYLVADVTLAAQFNISANVNICLNGFDIKSDGGDHRMLNISSGATLTLADCRGGGEIKGGRYTGTSKGVAVIIGRKAAFHMYGGIITDNETATDGGAVAMLAGTNDAGGEFCMYGGAITGNTAYSGGGIWLGGTSGSGAAPSFHMTGGTITGNTATNQGGGIYTSGSVNISNATISGNYATVNGAGIRGGGSTITLSNVTVSGNIADNQGGAIYCAGSTVTVTGGSMKENEAREGAAISAYGGSLILDGASIQSNITEDTGAVFVAKSGSYGEITVTLKGNLNITGNTRTGTTTERNLELPYDAGQYLIVNVESLEDTAKIGVYMPGARFTNSQPNITAKLNGNAVKDNFTSDNSEYTVELDSTNDVLYLKAKPNHVHNICNDTACTEHAELNWTSWGNTDEERKSLPTQDGNYYLVDTIVLETRQNVTGKVNLCLNGQTVTVKDTNKEQMVAIYKGGQLSITDCGNGQFTGVSTAANGAVFSVRRGAVLNLYAGTITGNTSTGSDGGGAVYIQRGNAAEGAGGIFNMYGGTISNNTANIGAAVRAGGTDTDSAAAGQFNMYGGTITGNTATVSGFGGGAIFGDLGTQITITGGTISENTTAGNGGAIHINKSQLTIQNATITGNEAKGTADTNGGGAIYAANGSRVTITDSLLSGNIASGKGNNSGGGAIYSGASTVSLEGCTLKDNEAKEGGAVYIRPDGQLTVEDCAFSGNAATVNGGAIRLQAGSMAVTDTQITNNTAETGVGGAVYSSTSGTIIYNNTQITGNEAGTVGGAMSVWGGKVTMTDVTVTGNHSGLDGAIALNVSGSYGTPALTLAGEVVIDGNTLGDNKEEHNLYLTNNDLFITVDENLSADSSVGITIASSRANTEARLFVSANTVAEALLGCFSSENGGFDVVLKEGKLYFKSNHGHGICGDAGCADHGEVAWMAWNDSTKLPNGGNYYLNVDVQLSASARISKDTNLCLNGHTVKAKTDAKIQLILVRDGADLTITDCKDTGTITGGYSTGNGGAINVQRNSVLNLYGGTITGSTAASGAAVCLLAGSSQYDPIGNGAVMNLYGGTITGNSSTGSGGAIYVNGTDAPGTYAPAQLNLYGGSICGNTAGLGGAIYCMGIFNMSDGTIDGNTAAGNGGAVTVARTGVMTMTGGMISNNKANGADGGGAVYLQMGNDTEGNGGVFTMTGGTIGGNESDKGGGVFVGTFTGSAEPAKFTMTGGAITGNKTRFGGGVYVYNGEASLLGGIISKNYTSSNGAGVYTMGGKLTMKGVTIQSNTAKGNGGGICTAKYTAADGTETVSRIIMNAGTSLLYNKASFGGGGMIQSKASMSMTGGLIAGNVAKNNGAGLYINTDSNFLMYSGTVTQNTSTKHGGGIYAHKANVYISGGKITANNANSNGGGVYLAGSTAKLGKVLIGNNTAKGTGGGVTTAYATVDKVQYSSKIFMDGTVISGNACGSTGGGMLVQSKATLTIANSTITENTTPANGGGIYVYLGSSMNMSGCTVSKNSGKFGGGIYQDMAPAVIADSLITENIAASNGAGLYVKGAVSTVTNTKIVNNVATGNAGGICTAQGYTMVNGAKDFVYSHITMTGGEISGNSGANAGGALIQSRAHFIGTDILVTGNTTTGDGGGIYIATNSFGDLTNVTITKNHADKRGAGLMTYLNTNVTAADCLIDGNTAGTTGGGVMCRGNLTMTNCQITNNTADDNGGGICTGKNGVNFAYHLRGLVLENCTVKNNASEKQGGGLYLALGSDAELYDVTVQGNKAEAEAGGLWAMDDLILHNITVTDNTSGGAGYAVYLAESLYDGHSYFTGLMKMTGDIKITGNHGGDMYMGQLTSLVEGNGGLGENTQFDITLDSGVLTNRFYGSYDYSLKNGIYSVSHGDRSLTDPEYDENFNASQQDSSSAEEDGSLGLVLGGAAALLALIVAAAAVIIGKNKKKSKTENSAKNAGLK